MWLALFIASECTPACAGTPAACASFTATDTCSTHTTLGCSWSAGGACGGTHAACEALPLSACPNTDATATANASNHGCYATSPQCTLKPSAAACTTYGDQVACEGQDCAWTLNRQVCEGHSCDPNTRRCQAGDGSLLPGCAISPGGCVGSVVCTAAQSGSCPPQCSDGPGCSQFGGATQQQVCTSVWPRTLSDARVVRLSDGHQRA